MQLESHYANLRESLEEIEDAIKKGITKKQRTIGFHTSAAAADMFEIILHRRNLITSGFLVKHDWFAAKNKIKSKLPYEFPEKEEIIGLIATIEEKRNILCYGRPRSEEEIKRIIDTFNKLKSKFIALGYGNEL